MAHTDQELVDRCLQGDEEAWAILADMIRRLVAAPAATRWWDSSAQDDVAQKVQAELLRDGCRALRQFAGRSRLSTYLGAIVIRVAMRLRRDDEPAALSELERAGRRGLCSLSVCTAHAGGLARGTADDDPFHPAAIQAAPVDGRLVESRSAGRGG